ncbi:helicase-associated domain-containing protein [Paenibacillus gallinarum]|uniref:Helicase-associated domain-containing protein n=1 Tax=Paenibacillus gallinarum TaxID=2762232 RepID=A0ABR8SWW3_9BACL|nr:helicase-associated domain-containing protein [Paenibacillus gallinarum]MBD7967834.1 helicase-associated domain-containing protein [Paenibacillus gallinarum]
MKNEETITSLEDVEWSANEAQFLEITFLEFGGNPFQMERLTGLFAGKMSGLELDIALFGLRKKGLIDAAKKTWGEHIYFIPSRHHPFLTEKYVLPLLHEEIPYSSSGNIQVAMEARPNIAGEILHLLSYIAIHGVPLTAKGTIHKKAVSKIENLTVLRSTDFEALKLSYAHPELYPVQVAVLLDVVFTLGLAKKYEAEIGLDESYVSRWVQLNRQQMERNIYNAMMERYSAGEAGLQHFRYLLTLFSRKDAGKWLSMDQICQRFVQVSIVNEQDLAEFKSYAKGWVTLLAAFGYGDTGMSTASDEALYFRWTNPINYDLEDSKHYTEPAIYVQPDFEVIVPPDAPYSIRWLLEGCAELAVRDHMTIYKLTRERLNEGAEVSITPSLVLTWLTRYAQGSIPENVLLALKQWGSELGRTSFSQVMLLSTENKQDADKIESYPSWNESLQRIGPLHFILERDKVTEVRKRLTMMGLTPAKAVKGIDTEERRYPAVSIEDEVTLSSVEENPFIHFNEEGRQGFVYTGRNLHYYEVVNEDRDEASIMPDITEVPKMWVSEWREYHPSTAKQLVQQAINWRTRMGVEMKGDRQEFIPESIGKGEPWAVNGWLLPGPNRVVAERCTLVPAEWTKLTLILPN